MMSHPTYLIHDVMIHCGTSCDAIGCHAFPPQGQPTQATRNGKNQARRTTAIVRHTASYDGYCAPYRVIRRLLRAIPSHTTAIARHTASHYGYWAPYRVIRRLLHAIPCHTTAIARHTVSYDGHCAPYRVIRRLLRAIPCHTTAIARHTVSYDGYCAPYRVIRRLLRAHTVSHYCYCAPYHTLRVNVYLEGGRTISLPAKDASSLCVRVLFEGCLARRTALAKDESGRSRS
jgi:hypothetical protein